MEAAVTLPLVKVHNEDKFSTLSDEVMEIILGYLDNPSDIASVSRASPVCERILEPFKTTWLFHAILPKVTPSLVKVDILNCRLVCCKWKKSIDNHLENSRNHVQPLFAFAPKYTTSFRGFCAAMKSHLGNPFPARDVDFCKVWDKRFTAGIWIHVLQFLSRFGHHIHTCRFDFHNARLDLFVIILRQCLAHLKNVRRLHISWAFDGTIGCEEKMREELQSPDFPKLEQLEYVNLSGKFSKLFHEKVMLSVYSYQLKEFNVNASII